jgi:hypothetical protein
MDINVTLSAEDLAIRKTLMTASDMKPLMDGNPDEIMRVYLEKIGERAPENLDNVWPVQLGITTEALNLTWFEKKNKVTLAGRNVLIRSSRFNWAGATLDAWCEELGCPVECKHVGGREPIEVIIDRYQPQMQWQMMVTDAEQCAISIIAGANEPIVEFIPRDNDYIGIEIDRAAQFMTFVFNREPPIILDPVPPPADAKKLYDMSTSNEWCSEAGEWLETREAASRNDDAAKILKNMVPADAKKAFGHGVSITRDRAGRLSLRKSKE